MPDAYSKTIDRLEPDIAAIDPGAYYASASISLRRIANSLKTLEYIAGVAIVVYLVGVVWPR